MKILKYGNLAIKALWPKIQTCQQCGSELEVEFKDVRTYYNVIATEKSQDYTTEKVYKCEACCHYNVIDKMIEDRDEYEKFNDYCYEATRKQLEESLAFTRAFRPIVNMYIPDPNIYTQF